MKPRFRYLSSLFINVALPWLAYRLAFTHWGHVGALVASALPLIAWMLWDWLRHRHFDALSALVLVGIALSLTAMTLGGGARMKALEDPMVSGMVGVAFLVSLALPRPLVFYLARSTMARESHPDARHLDTLWRERPTLAAWIRLMTLVWGLSLIGENALRTAIVWTYGVGNPHAVLASETLRYGVYAALTAWTFWGRRRIKQDAGRYPAKPSDPLAP
jgi:hypothetical protein